MYNRWWKDSVVVWYLNVLRDGYLHRNPDCISFDPAVLHVLQQQVKNNDNWGLQFDKIAHDHSTPIDTATVLIRLHERLSPFLNRFNIIILLQLPFPQPGQRQFKCISYKWAIFIGIGCALGHLKFNIFVIRWIYNFVLAGELWWMY